ncbi:TetR/AcrR family transcriptional regulator [Sphingobacterium psychroaquaticum]|uniref:TetR/AcrR family transcriptional regulator n=1 Tax=Sphingobacterium psychroaquaticum TaxID=561061 RepID=UPI00106B3623|nr:TetR/AcrR family transcriptional regulator [Sphingobacterium psychroaquaticum]QBQ41554.1 TetR/AcrR family transcriptional regulator [Sphingobacterium psychroaquaticum]
MGLSERKARQQEELRDQIIAQSWAIIEREGWQALSIRRIAEAIEYSVPVIYKYFENKEAILEYFTKEGFRALTAQLRTSVTDVDASVTQLTQLAHAYWHFAAQQTEHYKIMFGLGIPTCETINSVAEMRDMSMLMLEVIEAVVVANDNQEVDKMLKMKTLWSTLHGFIAIELLSHNSISKEPTATFKDAVDSFIFTLINKK